MKGKNKSFIMVSIAGVLASSLLVLNTLENADKDSKNEEPIIKNQNTEWKYLDKFQLLEYTEEEIDYIKLQLTEDEILYLSSIDYKIDILSLIKSPSFIRENFLEYLHYISNINDHYEIDLVVLIVNQDSSLPYSSKLGKIMQEKYYIPDRVNRYLNYEADDLTVVIENVNSNLDYDYYTNIKNTDISKEILLIANKYYKLKSDYYYGNLVTLKSGYSNVSGAQLSEVAANAFYQLVDAAKQEGLEIRNISAYRSYNRQNSIYNNYRNQNGQSWADKWSARPGHSEHQTGLALDVGLKGSYSLGDFENTKEFYWMLDNAYKYGFILRYPKDKQHITGYGYEPWHYRYVGVEAARYIQENKISFEEYYAYFVENSINYK